LQNGLVNGPEKKILVSETYVLDSFAILALLGGEPGGSEVAHLLRQAQEGEVHLCMSWINVGEVAHIVERRSGTEQLNYMLAVLEGTALEVVPVERELTLEAAHIKARYPSAYADAFAAALAVREKATLVTGDPEFRPLKHMLRIQWLPRNE